MTASYFLYFALLPFAVVAAVEIARDRTAASRLARHLVPILVLMAATIAPVARAYYVVRQDAGLRRTPREIASQSADVADYVHAAPRLRVWGGLGTTGGEHELFPGALALTLGGVALIAKRRSTAVRIYAAIARAGVRPVARRQPHRLGAFAAPAWSVRLAARDRAGPRRHPGGRPARVDRGAGARACSPRSVRRGSWSGCEGAGDRWCWPPSSPA